MLELLFLAASAQAGASALFAYSANAPSRVMAFSCSREDVLRLPPKILLHALLRFD